MVCGCLIFLKVSDVRVNLMLMVTSVLLATGCASTVFVPTTARDGEYITVSTELGASHRIQVPQGLAATYPRAMQEVCGADGHEYSSATAAVTAGTTVACWGPCPCHDVVAVDDSADSRRFWGFFGASSVPLELKRSYIVPESESSASNSLQVHLHHADRSTGSSLAVSWATPSAAKCNPELAVAGKTLTGVTRTYPSAAFSDGSAASFHHVLLGPLADGGSYNYSISCNGTSFGSSFSAPIQKSSPSDSYSFAIFGDMGVAQAAHDTVDSLAAVVDQLDAVYHIGDLSYARGNDEIWNQFFQMIEPVASKVPWDVIPGNHDMRSGDSSGECGLPMLARFETPSSRAAFPALAAKSDTERCSESFDFSEGNPYWWSTEVGHARIITYSTDSNLTTGSPQREWLQAQLEQANTAEARATHPWVLLMGHKPMYTASTYPGCISTRGEGEAAGEGTEGALTVELEELFVANKVDCSFYGHIHSYNRMFPVKDNGTTVERPSASESRVYRSPSAPVHMMIGMAGASHLGALYDSPAWSAHAEISFGWLKATFANSSALHLEFIANGDGDDELLSTGPIPRVHDEVWITK